MKGSLAAILIAVGLLSLAPRNGQAQQSGPAPYPNVDKPFALAAGDTVRLLSRILNEGGPAMRRPGRRLDFIYSTTIPASDAVGRAAQADRAAEALGPQAVQLGLNRLSIGICDTPACAQRRDPPSAWFVYQRTNTGWKRTGS